VCLLANKVGPGLHLKEHSHVQQLGPGVRRQGRNGSPPSAPRRPTLRLAAPGRTASSKVSFNAGLRDELLDGDLLFAQASQHRDRELAMSLQHRAPATIIGLQTAGAESLRARICRAGNDAIPTTSAARAGSEADHALTLKVDLSVGADHLFKEAYHIQH
jgi:hypothetical protein